MGRIAPSRVRQLEARLHPTPDEVGRLVLCCLERWPAEAQAAWQTACATGDHRQKEDLVERYEGTRPRLGGRHISLIFVPAPPDERDALPVKDDGA